MDPGGLAGQIDFVHDLWPGGMIASGVLGLVAGVIWWLRDPKADAFILFMLPAVAFLAGFFWPAWPLAIPAYGLWRLRRRLHPQMRIPLKDLRRQVGS